MYKMLLFLHKTDEEGVETHFREFTLKYLSELAGTDVKTAEVESSLLLEQKYKLFCEIDAGSKEEWDKKMNSKAGKQLNKDLMDFHQFITVIFVNYGN